MATQTFDPLQLGNLGEGVLFTSSVNVNLLATGTTTIFVVPSGKTFIGIGGYLAMTSLTGTVTNSVVPNWTVTESVGSNYMVTIITLRGAHTFTSVGRYYGGNTTTAAGVGTTPLSVAVAGASVQFNLTAALSGPSVCTGNVYMVGFYF